MTEVYELEPKTLWRIFYDLTQIPRPSRKEEKAREYVINFAKKHGFSYDVDDYGNVYIRKPASSGYENVPPIIVQGHLDMVCAKKDPSFDCEKDPITPYVDGDYVTAKDTSLGADNGVGVAMALSLLLEENLNHGPIEVLLTVEEEIGLFGAKEINPAFLKGRHLVNVDGEDWGVITIGCAGGGNTTITLDYSKEPSKIEKGSKIIINVEGLKGGHSGVDIHRIRANAIKLLAKILFELTIKTNIEIINFEGGSYINVIPSKASAEILVSNEYLETAKNVINKAIEKTYKQWKKTEPNMTISYEINKIEKSIITIPAKNSHTLINLLHASHHGVIRFSPVIEGLVETSMNLAKIKTNQEDVVIYYNSRSSLDEALENTMQQIEALYKNYTNNIVHSDIFPGWDPDVDNDWFRLVKEAYAYILGKEPRVRATHAGLEAGVIKGKIPDMQIVAIGPNLENEHSINERVEIKSVQNTYEVLKKIVSSFAEKNK